MYHTSAIIKPSSDIMFSLVMPLKVTDLSQELWLSALRAWYTPPVTSACTLFAGSPERGQYEQVLSLAARYLSPSQLGLLRFSLSLRRHSPRAALWERLAGELQPPTDCAATAFVQLGDRLLCSAAELSGAADTASAVPETFSVDHQYGEESAGPVTAVLYGRLGTESLCQLHSQLKRLAEQRKLNYVLRPYSGAVSSVPAIQGRGVWLSGCIVAR